MSWPNTVSCNISTVHNSEETKNNLSMTGKNKYKISTKTKF